MDFASRKFASHRVYEKQSKETVNANLLKVANTFGQRAADICCYLHERHHREDPFAVPDKPEHTVHEEHWYLDRDSRDMYVPELARLVEQAKSEGKATDGGLPLWGEDLVHELADIINDINSRRERAGHAPELFVDPHFPPNDTSIYGDPQTALSKMGGYVDPNRRDQGELADKLYQGGRIEWLRPNEFGDPTLTPTIYSGGIDPDDIGQGKLGNCYFLAAIQSCGKSEEDFLVRDLCVEDKHVEQCGMYAVKFWLNGRWVTVLVDNLIPCQQEANGVWQPIFSKPMKHNKQGTHEKELWALIFEKAWAKLNLSYEATDAGMTADTTNFLTAGTITEYDVDDSKWDELFQFVKNKDRPRFLSCSIKCPEVDPTTLMYTWGLVDGHAYSVLDLVQTNGQRFVQVRNPWGDVEWKGRFSDKSRDWTPQLKHDLRFNDQNDGTFWMLWQDFAYFFGTVEVCDPEAIADVTEGDHKHCRVDVFSSHWIRGITAGGPDTAKTFKHNPVCELTLANDGPVEICMYQPDVRPVAMVMDPQPQLLQCQLILKDTLTNTMEELFESSRRVMCAKRNLKAGHKYHLIAATWSPGVESAFWITVAGPGTDLRAVEPTVPSDEEASLMSLETPRMMCCVVCHNQDHEGYYQTKEGYKCESCQRNKRPALQGVGAKGPGQRKARPQAAKMMRAAAPPPAAGPDFASIPQVPQAPPPPTPNENACYYCDKPLVGNNFQTTQWGRACKPGCWPQAKPAASSVDYSYSQPTFGAPIERAASSFSGPATTVYPTVGSAGAVFPPSPTYTSGYSYGGGFPAVTTAPIAPTYGSLSYAKPAFAPMAPISAPIASVMPAYSGGLVQPAFSGGFAQPAYSGGFVQPAYSGGFYGGGMQAYGGQVFY